MDLPSNPPVSPAVRITVLLRLATEGFQDAFGERPAWLQAPPVDLAELREVVGVDRVEQLRRSTGLREGAGYAAGGVVNAHHHAGQLAAHLAGRPAVRVAVEPRLLGTGGALAGARRAGLLG